MLLHWWLKAENMFDFCTWWFFLGLSNFHGCKNESLLEYFDHYPLIYLIVYS